jgi:catechol 2,3-dioxygenase-like lactoylglutathione lyase family enzyme
MILHITLATRDVGRSSDFFARTLGWQPIQRPGNILAPAAWLDIGSGQELHLVQVKDFQPSTCEGEYGRHFAVSCPIERFAELKIRLQQQGGEVLAAERATPFQRFFFRDPNGYVFEVVESRRSPVAEFSREPCPSAVVE